MLSRYRRFFSKKKKLAKIKETLLILISIGIIGSGALLIWLSSLPLPDLNAFEQRKVAQSTKIYDRTGKILLYDIHENIRRTLIPYEEISRHAKNAIVAIEDAEFYQHKGIKPTAIIRAVLSNLLEFKLGQGGSTITQQVIKNSILTQDKSIVRKLKEWVLALKLERVLDKDTILGIYLNEAPYGGNIYGIEEASQQFFGKHASDLTLAESAYLAALPQAPSFYSPFGRNRSGLDDRKNLVLEKMLEHGFISKAEHDAAKQEAVTFNMTSSNSIKAPHFVFYVKDYLVKKYGEEAVEKNGYKVTTTLDYELQAKAEDIVKTFALQNAKDMDAENAAMVGTDPKTGQILVMVGSRDYFDKEIDGNFNVALAKRQPGSSFKPFAYAAAFKKGYTPETMLFDVKTEFSTQCNPDGTPKNPESKCYSPGNFDDKFRGPMTMRQALAQSINIPAIKALYLGGVRDTLSLARDMGITTLNNPDQYGFTVVLGGGEVTLLDLTSAYSVFANNGKKNSTTGILKIENQEGEVLEEYRQNESQVLDENVAQTVTDVLSDNNARIGTYAINNPLNFPGYDVAAKTGTTNDYRDAWIVGYTPTMTVGAWAGNNNNRPIQHNRTASYIVAPLWNAFMKEVIKKMPTERFTKPTYPEKSTLKPVLRGIWTGNTTYKVNLVTNELATEFTPPQLVQEKVVREIRSILHWVDKDNPNGPVPQKPEDDAQYPYWQYGVKKWAEENKYTDETTSVIPTKTDRMHQASNIPQGKFTSPTEGIVYDSTQNLILTSSINSTYPIQKIDYYLNGVFVGSSDRSPFSISFIPQEIESIGAKNILQGIAVDALGLKGGFTTNLELKNVSN